MKSLKVSKSFRTWLTQLNHLAFWLGGILLVILVTVFYQPAAAKTGALLVWQDGRIEVLDIDSLSRNVVATAGPDELLTPSPGCLGLVKAPCWVAVGATLYPVGAGDNPAEPLLLEAGERWLDSPLSWSPDGRHVAYSVWPAGRETPELRLHNAATGQTKTLAAAVDPALAVAWTAGCAAGLDASACRLAYKANSSQEANAELHPRLLVPAWADQLTPTSQGSSQLITLTPSTGEQQTWPVPVDTVFELRWTADNRLLYSHPTHYFRRAADFTPAYDISPGSQLANMSADGRYTVYYEPFTRKQCQAERPKGGCWYLGVWLAESGHGPQRRLVYSRELSQAGEGHLNADPYWSPRGDAFVLFREGNLVHYNLKYREAAAWYQGLWGQLTAAPVFSPHDEAIAFVVHEDETSPQYHLLVINPQFKPLEHVIDAQEGFRVLAWLPHNLQ